MATQLQLRRGTTAENDVFIGAEAEVTVDTTLKQLRVHDGATAGGVKVAKEADLTTGLSQKQDTSNLVTSVSSASTDTEYPSAKLVYDSLLGKADNNAVVHLTGTETITGDKTFSGTNYFTGTTNVPTPSSPNESSTHAANTQWIHTFGQRYITNCITEIPQDINLELNAGTLTLKAGSKCYLKTDTTTPSVNVASDLTTTQTTDGTYFAIYDGSALTTVLTTTYDYSTLPSTYSLPLAILTVSSGAISSIDQVFNGFGYIGSTVFALPGVKGLASNGRNADGTLKNINFTVENVTTVSLGSTGWHGMWSFYFNGSNSAAMIHPTELEYISDSKPTGINTSTAFWYSPSENKLYYTQDTGSTWTQVAYVRIDFTETSQKITSVDIEYPFRAVDYSDTEYIAHQPMPGDKYVDLTFSHGASYTAPADGYFVLCGYNSTSTLGNVGGIINTTTGLGSATVPTNIEASKSIWSIPAKKGEYVQMFLYNGTVSYCRFVYAQGAQ